MSETDYPAWGTIPLLGDMRCLVFNQPGAANLRVLAIPAWFTDVMRISPAVSEHPELAAWMVVPRENVTIGEPAGVFESDVKRNPLYRGDTDLWERVQRPAFIQWRYEFKLNGEVLWEHERIEAG